MRIFLPLVILVFISCEGATVKTEEKASKGNVITREWPNGNLRTEIPMKGKLKHGIAKNYYQDGAVRQEIEYVEGKKSGQSVFYYESGQAYRVTEYQDDNIHGTRKLYRENGNLMSETPFQNGLPCKGLKEYLVDGSLKSNYPELEISEIDESFTRGMVTLVIKPTEEVRKIEFYYGQLGDEGCFDPGNARKIVPQKDQEWRLYYPVPKGSFIMEEIHILAKITTTFGNPYFIQRTYNLAVENRG